MLKFTVPTNWSFDLIPKVKKKNVEVLYAKLAEDFVGGGRPSYSVPRVSKKTVSNYVTEVHKNGLKFNYLLNALCLDNLEWTAGGQKKIHRLLDWLMKIKVDSVTVAIPYLVMMIKKNYPALKVHLSVCADVNTVEKAKYWEELGVDLITLNSVDVNRNFRLLRDIRKNIKCELQLIANLNCLHNCSLKTYHSLILSHASQAGHRSRGFMTDYCYLSCILKRMEKPEELIKGDWIRPEDLKYYENIGIDSIKLVERCMTTDNIVLIVEAFVKRKHEGNLMDLFPSLSKAYMTIHASLAHKIKYFFRPGTVNVLRLLKRKFFHPYEFYIDNRALDGFINFFFENDCTLTDCDKCGYCRDVAANVVKYDKDKLKKSIQGHKQYLEMMTSGSLYQYI